MSIITVPVVNQSPKQLTVSFQSEYSVPFATANPDGVPAHCQPGGPGVVGGPEYVNLLQRTPTTLNGTGQYGYRVEQFNLSAYPGYTFFSFKNFSTGVNDLVAFAIDPGYDKAFVGGVAATPTGISGGTGAITLAATGNSGATGVPVSFSTPMNDASFATFTWAGTAVAAVTKGQGTTAAQFTVVSGTGSVGVKTVTMTVVNELGNILTTSKNITIS